MQEKDTVLEVKTYINCLVHMTSWMKEKLPSSCWSLEPAGWTLWKRQVSWLRSAMFPSASKEVSFCTDRFIRQW